MARRGLAKIALFIQEFLLATSHLGGIPVIGDNVFIGSGTKIIGEVKIGNNVTIGQNCVIVKDIADDTVVVSSANVRLLR